MHAYADVKYKAHAQNAAQHYCCVHNPVSVASPVSSCVAVMGRKLLWGEPQPKPGGESVIKAGF